MRYDCDKHGMYYDREVGPFVGCLDCVIDAKRIVLESAVGHVRNSLYKFEREPTLESTRQFVRDLRRALKAEDV